MRQTLLADIRSSRTIRHSGLEASVADANWHISIDANNIERSCIGLFMGKISKQESAGEVINDNASRTSTVDVP